MLPWFWLAFWVLMKVLIYGLLALILFYPQGSISSITFSLLFSFYLL
jgi:hypothetical protein